MTEQFNKVPTLIDTEHKSVAAEKLTTVETVGNISITTVHEVMYNNTSSLFTPTTIKPL